MIPGFFAAGAGIGSGGAEVDPYYANVVSLLNFPGADASTTFTDAKGKTWTRTGSAEIDTSLGYNAGYFPGSSYITSASNADFAMGTGDFTVEAWIRPSAVNLDRAILNVNVSGGLSFGLTGGKVFCGPTGVSYGPIGATTLTPNVLVHVEASRVSGTTRIFVAGVLDASASDAYNYGQATAKVGVGHIPPSSPTGYFSGWIRALRLTKGIGRNSSGFTPPAAPFPTS